MFAKFRAPSPATAIALLALVVALGGTAVATAPTLVKLVDSTGAYVADVDSRGSVATLSQPAPSHRPFFQYQFLGTGGTQVLILPSTSTFVLTDVTFSNPFGNTLAANVYLSQTSTASASDCLTGAITKNIGVYYAQPGQSIAATFPSGLVLKPFGAGKYWCLVASTHLKGNPAGNYTTELNFNGYVASGSF